jgi:hypothetical protein
MLVLDENGTPVPLVDLQGRFTSVGEYAGKYVKTNIITMVKLRAFCRRRDCH